MRRDARISISISCSASRARQFNNGNRPWRKLFRCGPDHISAYCLTYEEDTEFFLRQSRGELKANPDTDADFFEMGMSILEEAGYEHYEISNYARPGFSSTHNRAYWSGEDYRRRWAKRVFDRGNASLAKSC